MRVSDGMLSFSPSDLVGFVACPHLTTLEVAVARGELERPYRHDPHADLIRRKGDEHEAAYGAWRGLADFLERQAHGGYEVLDTKLARRAKPAHVLQLCFYTEQLARLQGR